MSASRMDPGLAFVDTPEGIFTAEGIWFRVREADLRAFAAPVLERVTLDVVVGEAVRGVGAGQAMGLWSLLLFLFFWPSYLALLLSVVVFGLVQPFRPLLLSRIWDRAQWVMQAVPAQGLAYIAVLSWMGMSGHYAGVLAGLTGFILFRWKLIERVLAPALGRIERRLYPLPMADQVLRSTIVRHALRLRVSLPELDAMERILLQHWGKR